jgi:hypothetical protein
MWKKCVGDCKRKKLAKSSYNPFSPTHYDTERLGSPEDPGSHVGLSKAFLELGQVDQSIEQLNYYRKVIKTYTHASQMYPTAHDVQQNYGHVLTKMGKAFVNAGLKKE